MKGLFKQLVCVCLGVSCWGWGYATDNQTDDLTPIQSESSLPFRVVIEKANFELPEGVHSGMLGVYQGLWVLIGGSHFGLHGFGPDPFPPAAQNRTVYVVNPKTGVTLSRSLNDPSSRLTQQQIDSLSVISPQGYQTDNTLFMTGGYGVDTSTGLLNTKPVLTAINLQGLVQWVTHPENHGASVLSNIRQLYNPVFQIAGGAMYRLGTVTQLIFGQNFTGVYTPGSNGTYSEQVRQFQINGSKGQLSVNVLAPMPSQPDPNYRRRDLNVVPMLLNENNQLKYGFVAYSGVFTPNTGIWTVPVTITGDKDPVMADPTLASTFKQGMNNYTSAFASFYSRKSQSMYTLFFGGISYGYYDSGTFQTDSEIPFINQVTTVKMDKNGNFSQYLMSGQYPVILSTTANPGNQLLFGAGSYFVPSNILQYPNQVFNLDNIRQATVIGYIVGGIASTLANTNVDADSFASTYVFKVTLVPVE